MVCRYVVYYIIIYCQQESTIAMSQPETGAACTSAPNTRAHHTRQRRATSSRHTKSTQHSSRNTTTTTGWCESDCYGHRMISNRATANVGEPSPLHSAHIMIVSDCTLQLTKSHRYSFFMHNIRIYKIGVSPKWLMPQLIRSDRNYTSRQFAQSAVRCTRKYCSIAAPVTDTFMRETHNTTHDRRPDTPIHINEHLY